MLPEITIGTRFTDPENEDIVWDVNTGLLFDGMYQAELTTGPEHRLGEMDLFLASDIRKGLA